MPLISIITVCLNSAATIRRTGLSLLEQNYQDWEWLVIDGGSTDETCKIVSELAPSDPRLKITSERDGGIFDAMNKGVVLSRGDYVYFLNSDDRYADNRVLEDVAATLKAQPSTDLLYGNINVESSDHSCTIHKAPGPECALDELVCGCLPHQATFARRELFAPDRIGLFDVNLRYGADYQWIMSAVADPVNQLYYLDREIAFFFNGGNSSHLEGCLPESFRILNRHTVFLEAIGQPRLLKAYQKQVFALRVEIGKLQTECLKQKAGKNAIRTHLAKAKQLRDEYKAKLKAINACYQADSSRAVRFPWLPSWLRF